MGIDRSEAIALRLSGMSYAKISEQYGVTRQRIHQVTRPSKELLQAVAARCGKICEMCCSKPMQHVHHKRDTGISPEEYDSERNLLGLCIRCHLKAHRRARMVIKGFATICGKCGHMGLALASSKKGICRKCGSIAFITQSDDPDLIKRLAHERRMRLARQLEIGSRRFRTLFSDEEWRFRMKYIILKRWHPDTPPLFT